MTDVDGESERAVAQGYDAVYRAIPGAPALWQIWLDHAVGADYPPEFSHISFATLDELGWFAQTFHLTDGDTLVDLACGMGGPSLWMVSQFGGRVDGVDASSVAVELATRRAARLGLGERSNFAVGTFGSTGLPEAHADAVLSLDALQYAPNKSDAFREMARILKPHHRLAFSAFEVLADRVSDVPVLGDDPIADYRPLLEQAGFAVEHYEQTPGWSDRLTRTYEAIVASGEALEHEMGADAYGSLLLEVEITLQRRPYRRRVKAVASRS